MPSDTNQRRAFEFLVEHWNSKKPFKKEDLRDKTDWSVTSFATYWSKQFLRLVLEVDGNKVAFRVSDAFSRFADWSSFQRHVTQVRRAVEIYKHNVHTIVRIYEFFMPLSNENALRGVLDSLFYKDTLDVQLDTISQKDIEKVFPRDEADNDKYRQGVLEWIGRKFGGYSIYHVSGRFRAGGLKPRQEALTDPSRYLIDETTAVTRFIFPCESAAEAGQVAFFFEKLFVRAILEVVNGEDEIWMVESGFENRLHVWSVPPPA
ncbi:MAG: hypothetical protein IT208_17045 [Chthonomonadales bacterium]|nr:hypothetical protein [Chthonomonadales bacterium]